jgi:hypothetical protein
VREVWVVVISTYPLQSLLSLQLRTGLEVGVWGIQLPVAHQSEFLKVKGLLV